MPLLFGWEEEPRRRAKRKTIPASVRNSVWNMYIGQDKAEGKCYVCKRTIHIQEFEVGHNKAKAKGGTDSISNLKPICRGCNSSMGTTSIEVYKKRHFTTKPRSGAKMAVGLDKVRKYLTRQGYEIFRKKHGFDLVGGEEGGPLAQDRYVAVGLNQERMVTGEYVLRFRKKVAAFKEKVSEDCWPPPRVAGLIAYTGSLSKQAPVLARGSKPAVKLKKL